jgi:hypothetical protein
MSDRLAEIKARADAIIPGPWRWYGNTETNTVHLATVDRGRVYIVGVRTFSTETVFHHDFCKSYTLEQARESVQDFCGAHEGEAYTGECRCRALQTFLSGTLAPEEGQRDLLDERTNQLWLTRGVDVHVDLRFPDKSRTTFEHVAEAERRRKIHGGRNGMRSYRKLARYETLGKLSRDGFFHEYRTREEFEAEESDRTVQEALYREDFCGLDNPEATFIEHAAEDIPYLLGEIDRLRRMTEIRMTGEK